MSKHKSLLRNLDPEEVHAAGFGTERPYSDHPEVLRNFLLRGDQTHWAHIVRRAQTEPEFLDLLRDTLTTVPHPEGWDEEDESANASDPRVESAAAPIFEAFLTQFEEPDKTILDAFLHYFRLAATSHDFNNFAFVAQTLNNEGYSKIFNRLSKAIKDAAKGPNPFPVMEFIQACYTPISDTEDVKKHVVASIKRTCRQLAQDLLNLLPEIEFKDEQIQP